MFLRKWKMKCFTIMALATYCTIISISCSNDILGVVYSPESRERFAYKDHFVYLDEPDRRLELGDTFSFIVLTDTHITANNTNGFGNLKNIIEENNDSFVVVTGDITQSGKSNELELFIEMADTFQVPCYPVIGNHDIFFGNWSVWKEKIGSTVYRVDADHTTLIMLDSANASFGAEQLDWLKAQLTSAKENTFVFTHASLFSDKASSIQQLTDIRERARIMSMLDGKCAALFTGHIHERIIEQAGSVSYITLEDFKSNGTYCRVKVSPGGVSYEINSLGRDL